MTKKIPWRKQREMRHARNTNVVQDYLRGVETGDPNPQEIMEKYHFTKPRLYQILKKFGIKPSFKAKWMDK